MTFVGLDKDIGTHRKHPAPTSIIHVKRVFCWMEFILHSTYIHVTYFNHNEKMLSNIPAQLNSLKSNESSTIFNFYNIDDL
jgi:hypothetical protein